MNGSISLLLDAVAPNASFCPPSLSVEVVTLTNSVDPTVHCGVSVTSLWSCGIDPSPLVTTVVATQCTAVSIKLLVAEDSIEEVHNCFLSSDEVNEILQACTIEMVVAVVVAGSEVTDNCDIVLDVASAVAVAEVTGASNNFLDSR